MASGDAGVVAMSLDQVTDYLTASTSTGSTTVTDVAGGVLVSGGSFEFTDNVVELGKNTDFGGDKDLKFASGSGTAENGYITIDGSGTLVGNTLKISSALNESTDAPLTDATITFSAKNLVLGNGLEGTIENLENISSGDESFVATESISFNANDNQFDVNRPFSVQAEAGRTASITGDNITVKLPSTDRNINIGGEVTWANNTTFTDSGAVINVGKAENGTGDYDGNTTLTVTGSLIAGTLTAETAFVVGTNAQYDNKDGTQDYYEAVLDLTQASLGTAENFNTATSKQINVQARSHGVVKMTGTQVSTILDEDSTNNHLDEAFILSLKDGTLDISGTLSAEFSDFTDLVADPAGKILIISQDSGAPLTNTIIADAANLTTGTAASSDTAGEQGINLNLYGANLEVGALTLNNLYTEIDADNNTTHAESVTITNGKYIIENSLTSNNEQVILGADAAVTLGNSLTTTGTVSSDLVVSEDSATLTVANGTWSGQDLVISADGSVTIQGTAASTYDAETDSLTAASFTGNNLITSAGTLTIGGSGNVAVNGDGTPDHQNVDQPSAAIFSAIYATGGSIEVTRNGTLTIIGNTGALTDPNDAESEVSSTNGVYLGASINVAGDVYFGEVATSGMLTENNGVYEVEAEVGGTLTMNGGTVHLAFADSVSLDNADLASLRSGLFNVAEGSLLNGVLHVGDASLGILGLDTGVIEYDDYRPYSDVNSDVTSTALSNALITNVDGPFRGHVGAVQTTSPLTLDQDASFSNSSVNNDLFVSYNGAAGDINGGSFDLGLYNGGAVNNITNVGDLTIDGAGNETTINSISDTDYVEITNGITNVTEDISAEDVDVGLNGSLVTNNITVTGTLLSTDNGLIKANSINGDVSAYNGGVVDVRSDSTSVTDGLITNTDIDIINGGAVYANRVELRNGGEVFVGIREVTNTDGTTTYEGSTGYFETQTLNLNGGKLVVDPAWDQATGLASITRFDDDRTYVEANEPEGGSINGQVFVGQNSALGIGTVSLDELRESIAQYQDNGSLQADKYGALVVVKSQFELDSGRNMMLTTKSYNDWNTYKTNNPTLSLDVADSIYFGANTAMVIDSDVLGVGTDKAAITFLGSNAKLISDGGEIVVDGVVNTTSTFNIFDATGGSVGVINTNGEAVTNNADGILVQTDNGLLVSYLTNESNGDVKFSVNSNYSAILSGASDPVVNSIVQYAARDTNGAAEGGELYGEGYTQESWDAYVAGGQSDPSILVRNEANNALLNHALNYGDGAAVESVARMAIYGGAVQAAIAANTSSYEAIAARTGVGATASNLNIANNGMGGSIWLAPMYKNQDSDSFDAEGLSYGVDMDLYGVALGADFEFMPSLTAGIMFNVGSGSADGQGNAAASSVSNDFDYYGISVYGNYKYDALSITADLGYTAVDSDIDAHTGLESYGTVSTSVDSTAWTLGVTGKYTFNVGGVELAPHAGLRYSSIDLDDYSVSDIASYDADTMDIFSIPVGVTIAKEFQGESWSVKPSLDLSVQGNFGDDTSDGTVHWTGVDGLATNVSSEMMDNFTYGATLGVSAQTGSFSMGLGVNYTGSDNVDEFGVNANARFVF